MIVLHRPAKANVISYVLRRLSMGCVTHVVDERKELLKDVHRLAFLAVLPMSISESGVTI